MELPDPTVSQDLIQRYAAVSALLSEELDDVPLVLPNAQFFPDQFEPSEQGVRRLLRRMQAHAGIDDIPVRVRLAESSEPAATSCSSGACAPKAPGGEGMSRIVDSGDGWSLQFARPELAHPVGLTTALSRALAAIFLEEVRGARPLPKPAELTYDLAAVRCGFGVLLLEGSHVYSKSCGGPNIAKLTALSVSELAVAVAVFAGAEGHALGPAKRVASPTQKAALGLAGDLAASNQALLQRVAKNPDAVASESIQLKPPKTSWFGLFNKGRKKQELEEALLHGNLDEKQLSTLRDEMGDPRSSAGSSVDDDLKQLVSESLSESRAG